MVWVKLPQLGGFMDKSELVGTMLFWQDVQVLEPLEQERDGSGMIYYRTNAQLSKIDLYTTSLLHRFT